MGLSEGTFEQSLIDEMFENYMDILDRIADGVVQDITLGIDDFRLITEYNETQEDIQVSTLQKMFVDSAYKYPDLLAVSCKGKVLPIVNLTRCLAK